MWSYTEGELGSEFAEPIRIYDMSNVTPEVIINSMKEICEQHNIPASFSVAEVVTGGASSLFDGSSTSLWKVLNKKTYKAVEVSHPNPPQQYCSQLYVIVEDGIMFFYVGASKAFKERNEYERAMRNDNTGISLKGMLKAIAGIVPDEEPYNLEMEWHSTIYSVFGAILD